MATNLFPRYTGSDINLDGRDGTLDDGSTGASGYTLVLSLSPAQVEPNGAVTATVSARVNGQPLVGQVVALGSTNSAVAPVTASITTVNNGDAVFSILGLTLGTATISALMVVGGVTYTAVSVVLTVSTQTPPANYNATGYGRIVVSVESPLANALTGRVQRLSHAEQQRKYPDDQGLKWATYFETATVTIVPKVLQT